MISKLEIAVIIGVFVGVVFLALFAAAGIGSTEASVGHFLKDTFHGSLVEQPAASIESAGNDLTAKAHGAIAFFTGLLVLVGLMYVGSKSKS
jgi:hypothetical protein